MRYVALIGDQEREVELTELAAGRYQLSMNGRTLQLDARHVSDTTLSLIWDQQAFNVELEAAPNGKGENILVRGHVVNVEVLDLRTLRLRRAQEVKAVHDGPAEVTAPMPGKVVDVLVRDGQEVNEGQGLIVVEAMKMENELRSPRAGVVRDLRVRKGDTVEGGVSLCVVG